ncbi:MAG: cytochrome c [Anaerolineales bacterium]|jgi:cytochrome c553|nr:cytochrome c [Anaerolineales bacterium]
MRKFFKWLGIVLGSLIGLIVFAALGLYLSASIRLNKTYSVQAETITIPSDSASIERGKQWVESGACKYCHGDDLAGTAFLEDPMLGKIPARNLTSGKGGVESEFTDADWVRAIRYGINPQGQSLIIMPSSYFYYFSDSDLGDIIAYLKSLPPVDKEWSDPEFTPFGKILVGVGVGNVIETENINYVAVHPPAPTEGVTAVYGEYLVEVSACRMCHGEDLAGDENPPNPAAPAVPGLAAGSEVASWSEAEFIQTIRTGVTPSGRPLTEFMPWTEFRNMTDNQLKAIWLYLNSLSAE